MTNFVTHGTDKVYQHFRDDVLNHPFPTKQLVNAIMQLDFDTKIKPYTIPNIEIVKHDMLASLNYTLNIPNDPNFINSLRFNSLTRWKNLDTLEDKKQYKNVPPLDDDNNIFDALDDITYSIKKLEMICNITVTPVYLPILITRIAAVFGKNEVLDHFRLQKKYQNLVHADLVNVVKNTAKQYLVDVEDGEVLNEDMNATSLYLQRNLPNRSITDNVKKLHYDLVRHLKGLKRNTKQCKTGTIDDCGNEHADANKTVIMSQYECYKGFCEARVECQTSEDCHTTTLTSRFHDTSLSFCYRNYCTLKHTTENSPCGSDIECAGNGTKYGLYCINKRCKRRHSLGESCFADFECKSNLFCYSANKQGDGTETGVCTPRKKEGDTCDRDDCGPSPPWRCGADGTCTKNTGNAGSTCVDDADCLDELTCQKSTCRIHMGGTGCSILSGSLDIDNANNKHCFDSLVCEKDVCIGDIGVSCEPQKEHQCKDGLECNIARNRCERKQCNSFGDCPKDFLCSRVKVDDNNPFEQTEDINDRSPKINAKSSAIHEDNKNIKACTRKVGMRCSHADDCTHPLATCHRGWCLANNGMTCEKDSECMPPDLICFSHQCQLDPINRTNYHKCDAFAKELCVADCMEKAGLNDVVDADGKKKTILYDTRPSYGHETYNETRSNYCGLCCLDCFCDNSEDHWKSFGRTLFNNFLHLDKPIEDEEDVETPTPTAEEEVNEMFKPGDVNNTAPLKFEKLADSAAKGEERKKQILGAKKEESDLLGR